MRKIPTLFKRDENDRKHVTDEVNPECQWVLDGEGKATRKYDGTCFGYFAVVKGDVRLSGGVGSGEVEQPEDLSGVWLARREVKPSKTPPANYLPISTDEVTGKTVGWEPAEQSAFAAIFNEALPSVGVDPYFGTYELVGPKINKNPERTARHRLVRHFDADVFEDAPRSYDGLREWLLARDFEGIVWHHPDGRMAKIKRRDLV